MAGTGTGGVGGGGGAGRVTLLWTTIQYRREFKHYSLHHDISVGLTEHTRPVGWILLRGVLLFFGRYFLVPERGIF